MAEAAEGIYQGESTQGSFVAALVVAISPRAHAETCIFTMCPHATTRPLGQGYRRLMTILNVNSVRRVLRESTAWTLQTTSVVLGFFPPPPLFSGGVSVF